MVEALTIERLGRRYRRARPWALRDVSLSLEPATISALVGPNGAGKSTLIRCCLGFERPDAGRVLVGGADPQRHRVTALSALGYVPQSASLYRSLSISDHLTMGVAARRNFDASYAGKRLKQLGLSPARRVSELSGGEQAQVSLAIALATRAPLLLLDEPLASLDPLARREFLTVLLDHVREYGTTTLLSSHIVTDVEQACSRILVLTDGRLVLDAPIAQTKTRFRTMAARELNGASVVGRFAGPDGALLALVDAEQRVGAGGRAATLEEIVLGYLAAGRSNTRGE